jgi:hypothetical protein
VKAEDTKSSLLSQTAVFAPKGLAGLLYWYALYPIHSLIFSGLLDRVARRAEKAAEAQRGSPPDAARS